MPIKGSILKHKIEFDNARYFRFHVSVWKEGRIIDFGGVIESHSDQAVFINGGKYLKANCEFKVR
ncbi:hypothetical protein PAESOLCIP111_01148 [Paenibacillus solanacearum]|uniref:Uncharacterized protein n=1 Tax=Paenibacillus solanacearum TaxID=2048548 RepID=A0A916NHD9_9BACL|nr:hypothetical protein PAESOLCIP111_01148 [Paenibacillus solanacearum]